MTKPYCGFQRRVVDLYLVVCLVSGTQGPKHLDGGVYVGLLDQDGLEPSLQRSILLDIPPILILGGGAHALELSPGERGLHHVAGVYGSLCSARADDGMYLVDEQDYLALRLLDLVDHRLQPFLELSAKLGAGHHRTHLEGQDAPPLELFRDVSGDNALGQSLGDGGLADTCAADKHRVVLRAADQRLHGTGDLRVAAYDRVQLSIAGQLGQVDAIALQGAVAALCPRVVDPVTAADLL